MRLIHVPCHSSADPIPALEGGFGLLADFNSIGVVASIQHLNRLDDVVDFLKAKGMKATSGGQVLGCQQARALAIDVDCYLYVGSGRFHPLGIAMKTERPVFCLNPISQTMDRILPDELRRRLGRRKGAMSRAMESQVFGIMVSTKDGQFHIKKALELKKRLKEKGREAFVFAAEEVSPNNLLPFRVDCWVNTACPRISEDEYNRPVLNPDELEDALAML